MDAGSGAPEYGWQQPQQPLIPGPSLPLAVAAPYEGAPELPTQTPQALPQENPEVGKPPGFFEKLGSGLKKVLPYALAGARGAGIGAQSSDPFAAFSQAMDSEQTRQRNEAMLPFEMEQARIDNEQGWADIDKANTDRLKTAAETDYQKAELAAYDPELERQEQMAKTDADQWLAFKREQEGLSERIERSSRMHQRETASALNEEKTRNSRVDRRMKEWILDNGGSQATVDLRVAQAKQANSRAGYSDALAKDVPGRTRIAAERNTIDRMRNLTALMKERNNLKGTGEYEELPPNDAWRYAENFRRTLNDMRPDQREGYDRATREYLDNAYGPGTADRVLR